MVRRKELNIEEPDDDEDRRITRAAENDPDNPPVADNFFRKAKSVWEFPELVETLKKHGKIGRPPLPPEQRKRRVTLHLDPDVIDGLKADGKGWQTRANAALRKALKLK